MYTPFRNKRNPKQTKQINKRLAHKKQKTNKKRKIAATMSEMSDAGHRSETNEM